MLPDAIRDRDRAPAPFLSTAAVDRWRHEAVMGRWLSGPPGHSLGNVALALLYLDGVFVRDIMTAVIGDVRSCIASGQPIRAVVNVLLPRIGWRAVVLSETTRALMEKSASSLNGDIQKAINDEAGRLCTELGIEVGRLPGRALLRWAASYCAYYAPPALFAWAAGRQSGRATSERSLHRLLPEATLSPYDPQPGKHAALRVGLGGDRSTAPGDLLSELGHIRRTFRARDAHLREARLAASEACSAAVDWNDGTGLLFATYIDRILDPKLQLSLNSVRRYGAAIKGALADAGVNLEVDDSESPNVTSDDVEAIERAARARYGDGDAPTSTAIALLSEILRAPARSPGARKSVAPAILICRRDIQAAHRAISAYPHLTLWQRRAACALIDVGAAAGLRISEALHLRYCDLAVFGENIYVTVDPGASGLRKSKAARRVIAISIKCPEGARFLEFSKSTTHLDHLRQGYIYSGPLEREVDASLANTARLALSAAVGCQCGYHALRHFWATTRFFHAIALASQASDVRKRQLLLELQQEIGHADLNTTFTSYVHLVEFVYADWVGRVVERVGVSPRFLAAVHDVSRKTIWDWRRASRLPGSGRSERYLDIIQDALLRSEARLDEGADTGVLQSEKSAKRGSKLLPPTHKAALGAVALRFAFLRFLGSEGKSAAYLSGATAAQAEAFTSSLIDSCIERLGTVRRASLHTNSIGLLPRSVEPLLMPSQWAASVKDGASQMSIRRDPSFLTRRFARLLYKRALKCSSLDAVIAQLPSWCSAPDSLLRCWWPRDESVLRALLLCVSGTGVRVKADVHCAAELVSEEGGHRRWQCKVDPVVEKAVSATKGMGVEARIIRGSLSRRGVRVDIALCPTAVTGTACRRSQPRWNLCVAAALVAAGLVKAAESR